MTMQTTDNCGCPAPSGLSRRGVLGRALAVGAGGTLAGLVGDGLSSRLAFAATPAYTGDTLVVLSLRGGFDGLSAVVPAGDPEYYRARPTIGVPRARLIGGDAMFGLHPALAPLVPFWQSGKLAAVHAVGQSSPSRSHFAAMEELERAAPGTSLRTGWLDRMLGLLGATNPFNGVSIGHGTPSRAMYGPTPDLGLRSIDSFQLAGDSTWAPMANTVRDLYVNAPEVLAAPARAASAALTTTTAMAAAGYTPANGATYPDTDLGKALRDVARLIKRKVGLMTACVDFGDWDMHEGLGLPSSGQWMHDHLAQLAKALAAFATDLGPAGMSSVTLLTLSEFGRRVQENGSKGTDHGHGNAMLLLGGAVRGGKVYGRWPGLAPAQLFQGDLATTTDYRAVIGEVLQRRCGVGSLTNVFPGVTPTSFGLVAAR
ncbi:MAG TPA: DUF1501 domain-containing protein [Micromonosporaceae bacterium]|nr:DUF1501 domain-containing protein [Micromonosporaceae bacterium]